MRCVPVVGFSDPDSGCNQSPSKCLYALQTIGRYSVRLANKEEHGFKWEKESGMNQLGAVTVSP